jgi:tetratricopeptide (TPR) repeat protein
MREYVPFEIEIKDQVGDDYPVLARCLDASWPGSIGADLDLLTQREVEQALDWLERGYIDHDYARDLGARLFDTLFHGEMEIRFRAAYGKVTPQKALRVVLTLPEALAGLPWELMYDRDGQHGFLARSLTAPLVRRIDSTEMMDEVDLPEEGPLRVLIVTASPGGFPPLSSKREVRGIVRQLTRRHVGFWEALRLLIWHLVHGRSLGEYMQRLRGRSLVEIDVLTDATREKLHDCLLLGYNPYRGYRKAPAIDPTPPGKERPPYHVVHFIGHGMAGEEGGSLLLQGEGDKADPLPAEAFAEELAGRSITLVVLNACQTASAPDLFRGVAQAILLRGVPAVIGMQTTVMDRVAADFAQEFYRVWAVGEYVVAALADARRHVSTAARGGAVDWGIPVLFMRSEKGLRLQMQAPTPRLFPLGRGVWAVFMAFIALLGILSALLGIPQLNEQLRTEVPVIRCLAPYPMEAGYRFNIVVTRFAVQRGDGPVVAGKDGYELAHYLAQQLDANFQGLDLKIPHQIRFPEHTCRIAGQTRAEREKNAAALARGINADIVLYGVIDDSGARGGGAQGRFSPEFYVNYKGFEHAQEVVGQYSMGKGVPVDLPIDPAHILAVENPALAARTEALSLMTIGLAYYSIDDYETATGYFSRTLQVKGWVSDPGKAVVHNLLGNADIQRASRDNSTDDLEPARKNYQIALELDSTFARAMVGVANVTLLEAYGDPNDGRLDLIDQDQLDQAEDHYRVALELGDPPESADIEPKVHFGIGQVNLYRYLYRRATGGELETPLATARAEFAQVVEEYKLGNVRISDLAGRAYGRLALLAKLEGETEDAIASYVDSLDLVSPLYKSYHRTLIGELYAQDCQIETAIEWYEQAIEIAEFYGHVDQAKEYAKRLNELRALKTSCG